VLAPEFGGSYVVVILVFVIGYVAVVRKGIPAPLARAEDRARAWIQAHNPRATPVATPATPGGSNGGGNGVADGVAPGVADGVAALIERINQLEDDIRRTRTVKAQTLIPHPGIPQQNGSIRTDLTLDMAEDAASPETRRAWVELVMSEGWETGRIDAEGATRFGCSRALIFKDRTMISQRKGGS
jgi:hypothetical protein